MCTLTFLRKHVKMKCNLALSQSKETLNKEQNFLGENLLCMLTKSDKANGRRYFQKS